MFKLPSVTKMIAVLAVAFVIAIGVSSCASQKMGCPGSITQAEKPAESHS